MKTTILFFALFCAFFANQVVAQATKYPYSVTPKDPKIFCQKGCTDLLQGTLVLAELNIKIEWSLIYNKKEGKVGIMTFSYPTGVDAKKFETTIQAMTSGEYFAGIILCQGTSNNDPQVSVNCINRLSVTALQDCAAARGTNAEGVHCWQNN